MRWFIVTPRTPSTGEKGGDRPRSVVVERTVRDYVCAAVGLAVAVAGVAILYPAVAATGHPTGALTMTALVCLFVVVWLAVWTFIEAVWVRRTGRPNGS